MIILLISWAFSLVLINAGWFLVYYDAKNRAIGHSRRADFWCEAHYRIEKEAAHATSTLAAIKRALGVK
jgi:hypothetical protein